MIDCSRDLLFLYCLLAEQLKVAGFYHGLMIFEGIKLGIRSWKLASIFSCFYKATGYAKQ